LVSKGVGITAAIVLGILSLVAAFMAYSYSQIQVRLNDIDYAGINWAPISGSTLVNALTGNYLGAGLSLIDGVKLNLLFEGRNNGVIPIEVPDVSYDLFINGVNVGKGQSYVNTIINPGESKVLPVTQDIQKSSIQSAAYTLIESGGKMNIEVRGTSHLKFFGLTLPIPFPFEASKQISITDEIKKRFSSEESSRTPTYISMASSSSSVYKGDSVYFTGSLTDENGNPIGNALITIKDGDTFGIGDDFMKSGYTDMSGYYQIVWTASVNDPDSTADSYALFEGDSTFESSRSSPITVKVAERQQSTTLPTVAATSLTLSASSSAVYEGDNVSFTGYLLNQNGIGLANKFIQIMDGDTLGIGDDFMASGYTDANGHFSIVWTSNINDPDGIADSYATYAGSSEFGSSKSNQVKISVSERQQSPPPASAAAFLTLSVSSTTVYEGNTVVFTGQLQSQEGVANKLVKIMDGDPIGGDDFMASGYTDMNGDFSIVWVATVNDPDSVADAYALFDGNSGSLKSNGVKVQVIS